MFYFKRTREGMQETHRVTKLDIYASIEYELNTINSK